MSLFLECIEVVAESFLKIFKVCRKASLRLSIFNFNEVDPVALQLYLKETPAKVFSCKSSGMF